ncbi:hypothetical protein ABIC89_000410 [Variovorax boronicumulans]|uniref:hypothetical protein n=1 Tax=Variovorax boronicumulans TaxID=436515 RepID=UPI003390CADF
MIHRTMEAQMWKGARWPMWAALGLVLFIGLGVAFDWGKSDWAAWVQAVGSVVAIVATGRFVRWQHELESERQEREHRRASLQKLRVIKELVYANSLFVRFVALQFANRQASFDAIEGRTGFDPVEIDRVGSHTSGIPLHDLEDSEVVRCVLISTQYAMQVKDLARRAVQDYRSLNAKSFENIALRMEEAASQCELLHKTLEEREAIAVARVDSGHAGT